jgi:hypothetical protein
MNPVDEISKIRTLQKEEIQEIRNGAYVIVKDGGHLYKTFFKQGVTRIWCEHPSKVPVYDLKGVVGNVLIGMNGDTWLQWERTTCWSLQHVYDWCRFICIKKNQGPFGETDRTDKYPLIIEKILQF